jgi:sulfur-carrier protein
MPRVAFTGHLRRYLDLSEIEVEGATVGAALARVFERQPKLRAYVLDEQGHVRQHVSIYVGGSQIVDREKLSDRVGAGDEIYVLQALSGG